MGWLCIHSNSDIDVAGNQHSMAAGDVEYVTAVNPSPDFRGKVIFDESRPVQSTVKPYPVNYSLADFAPGGVHAEAADALGKYYYIRGHTDLKKYVQNGRLSEGLYFVEGSLHLQGNGITGRATFVATDEIQLSAHAVTLQPYVERLLAFSASASKRFDTPGIKISASGLRAAGIIFAPDSAIRISASDHALSPGALIGRSVDISGSGFQVNGYELLSPGLQLLPAAPALAFNAADMSLSLPTISGRMYVVEYTDSLTAPDWQQCAVIEGNGAIMSLKPPCGATQRFFRVRVE